jgi:RNA polymerase sigma-70 factor (family 1)
LLWPELNAIPRMKKLIATDERYVLQQLRDGDETAFETIYNTYYQQLTGHILRLLKSTELAKEVVQDTFMSLWMHRGRIDVEKPIKAYLFKIATNNAYNIFKRAAHDEKLKSYLYPAIQAGYEHIEAHILAKENEQRFRELLQRMPAKQRIVYTLCRVHGKSYEEVSQELNISTGTIHTHIKRANRFLKKQIASFPEFAAYLFFSLWLHTM